MLVFHRAYVRVAESCWKGNRNRMRGRDRFTHDNSRGFSILEMLIALMVLSLGLLGMASLQITGLRSLHMGKTRTQVTYLAYEMADRIRANPAGAQNGDYDGTAALATINCEGQANACVPSSMAQFDMSQWAQGLTLVPGGTGQIASTVPGEYTITVRWDEELTGATGLNCPPQSENDLSCYELGVSL